ncbi:MAG: hypothetical protein C0522_14330, partial [Rhodocyclaceae bacterium]|nr:hypothetical protein [Rhodocyclaceae bacterium]
MVQERQTGTQPPWPEPCLRAPSMGELWLIWSGWSFMKLRVSVLGLSAMAAAGLIWLASLVATTAFAWLQNEPSPAVRML